MQIKIDLETLLKKVWIAGYVAAKLEKDPRLAITPLETYEEAYKRWLAQTEKTATKHANSAFSLEAALKDIHFIITE